MSKYEAVEDKEGRGHMIHFTDHPVGEEKGGRTKDARILQIIAADSPKEGYVTLRSKGGRQDGNRAVHSCNKDVPGGVQEKERNIQLKTGKSAGNFVHNSAA